MSRALSRYLGKEFGPLRHVQAENASARSVVWRVACPAGLLAVKADRSRETGRVARETAVLHALGMDVVGWGELDGRSWLAVPWRQGRTTDARWTLMRAGSTHPVSRRTALVAALELANAVARLHAAGWVHGNLRPEHGLHTPGGVYLTSWGDAQAPGRTPPLLDEEFPYTGGRVDLAAPEVCVAIAGGRIPTATRAAEVYTLAAVLWECWTGKPPVDYAVVGVSPFAPVEQRADAVFAGLPTPRVAHRVAWAALESVLTGALAYDFRRRPTATEFARALERLMLAVTSW